MELRSVAYNPNLAPGVAGMQGMTGMQGMPGMEGMAGMQGMQGMAGMQGMEGMQGMQGMPGMQGMAGMHGMHGMPGGPGMYPPGGFVNLDVDMDPGFVSLDLDGPRPCSPCGTHGLEAQQYQQQFEYEPERRQRRCPMPTPTPSPEVYVVKKGDSVWKIAQRYGTTMQAIILANNLRNPDLIYPGQILLIPGASTEEFYG